MSILEVNHIKKVYKTRMGGDEVTALRDVHFSVEPGEFVAIMGESGSGKTTLLNILASLDTPTAGKVLVDGKDFTTLKDNERAIFRRSNLGFDKDAIRRVKACLCPPESEPASTPMR